MIIHGCHVDNSRSLHLVKDLPKQKETIEPLPQRKLTAGVFKSVFNKTVTLAVHWRKKPAYSQWDCQFLQDLIQKDVKKLNVWVHLPLFLNVFCFNFQVHFLKIIIKQIRWLFFTIEEKLSVIYFSIHVFLAKEIILWHDCVDCTQEEFVCQNRDVLKDLCFLPSIFIRLLPACFIYSISPNNP